LFVIGHEQLFWSLFEVFMNQPEQSTDSRDFRGTYQVQ